jgi:hypothetical protein
MDDLEQASSTTTDAPLTLSAAVKAITAPAPATEVDTDHPDADSAQDGIVHEDQAADADVELEGGAGGEDPAESDEDEDEPDGARGRYVAHDGRVRLPDGTEATVSDLIAGNLRNADATRKWQEAAELRRSAEAQSATTFELQQQLAEQRDYIARLIQSIVPDMPGPDVLAQDPQGYMEQRADAEEWARHLQYLDEQRQRDHEVRQAETVKATKARLAREWTTALEKLPELSDPQRLEAFGKDTLRYGAAYGYTPDEISRIHHDHRQLLVFKDAIAWRKLQAKRASGPGAGGPTAKGPERPPVLKGGNRLNPRAAKARQANAAMDRLNQSGSLKDGVAALIARTQSKG